MIYLLLGLLLLSGYGILHTYLVFPWLSMRGRFGLPQVVAADAQKQEEMQTGGSTKNLSRQAAIKWPDVALLMAVHNEELVLERKLAATLAQDYPGELRIYVGCDNCSDQSWPILQDYMQQFPAQIFASPNPARLGKPKTINRLYQSLADEAKKDSILWLTDASVIPATDCLSELVRPMLKNPQLVLVDAQQLHTGIEQAGISRSEDIYINREALLKQAESAKYGYLIGPFGGCYTLRASHFTTVPDNFLVDDFYLCMAAYELGGKGVSAPAARAYEGVGQSLEGEFKRKVRIATGNWQNLTRFRSLWWPLSNKLAYAFFSHKVLRWWTPMLGIVFALCLGILAFHYGNYWAQIAFYGLSAVLLVPSLLDLGLRALDYHWLPLRNWRYFIAMNLALLLGFFRYLKGVKSNVWQPSKRH